MANPGDVEVGRRYRVSFDDCCVAGSFEAGALLVKADNEFVYVVNFDNGVKLTQLNGVEFQEIHESAG